MSEDLRERMQHCHKELMTTREKNELLMRQIREQNEKLRDVHKLMSDLEKGEQCGKIEYVIARLRLATAAKTKRMFLK